MANFLLERKAAEGVKIEYPELREKSSSLLSPTDVGGVDDWVIQRVNELRQHSDVVLDSHALTAETSWTSSDPVFGAPIAKAQSR